MPQTERTLFTGGVFPDAAGAARGIEQLKQKGFLPEALSLIAKETPEVTELVQRVLGTPPGRLEVSGLGPTLALGSLVTALDGPTRDFARLGLSGTLSRVGFQAHDGQIFEALTARGGILVAVRDEPRAADALSTLHAYGAGNAAIGAWMGRL